MIDSLPNQPPDRGRAHCGADWNESRPVASLARGASRYDVMDRVWQRVSRVYLPYPIEAAVGGEDLTRTLVRGTTGGGHNFSANKLPTNRGRRVPRHV